MINIVLQVEPAVYDDSHRTAQWYADHFAKRTEVAATAEQAAHAAQAAYTAANIAHRDACALDGVTEITDGTPLHVADYGHRISLTSPVAPRNAEVYLHAGLRDAAAEEQADGWHLRITTYNPNPYGRGLIGHPAGPGGTVIRWGGSREDALAEARRFVITGEWTEHPRRR